MTEIIDVNASDDLTNWFSEIGFDSTDWSLAIEDNEVSSKLSREEYAQRGAALKRARFMSERAADERLAMVRPLITRGDLHAIFPEQWEICVNIASGYTKGDRDAAEDICQEAFLKADLYLWKLDGFYYVPREVIKHMQKSDDHIIALGERTIVINDPAAWLHTIVRNIALNECRRRKRINSLIAKLREDLERESRRFEPPEMTVIRNITNTELHNYVNCLPEQSSKIIKRHYFEGVSYEEIAKDLGCEPTTVRTRAMRALNMLKDVLQGIRDVKNGKIGRPTLPRNHHCKRESGSNVSER